MRKFTPSFYARHDHEIKVGAVLFLLLTFAGLYSTVPSFKQLADLGVTPAVAGVTMLYGKATTLIYKYTGLDLGFVSTSPDLEFLFNVRLATYINERRAVPLLEIAGDTQFSNDQRESALASLLKFESSTEWIQPFLNELPKGGLLGLYDDESPMLDELVRKVRAEGGVRQPLVRAYAEVVFAFMLQVPDVIVRQHACKWVSDVVAEDAVFLLAARLDKEKDPKGQEALSKAFYEIRAISEPDNAREILSPFYRNPPWPSLKRPLSIVLARLGYDVPVPYLARELKSEQLDSKDRVLMSLAVARTPYARLLKISENEERLMAERKATREQQQRAAVERRERIMKQEQVRMAVIARANGEKTPSNVVAEPAAVPASAVVPAPPSAVSQPAQPIAKKKAEPKSVPKPFPVPGAESTSSADAVSQQQSPTVASVSSALPLEENLPQPRSLMNAVDVVFEVKNQPAPLFYSPAEKETGVVLEAGIKGKADFEFLIGEEHWYQVKTKKGGGWVDGSYLKVFNLSPTSTAAVPAKPKTDSMDGSRDESTYFEAAVDDTPMFDKPMENAKRIGTLKPDVAYKAVKSEKVGPDRWFLLQIKSGENAWVRGLDLRLSSVESHPNIESTPDLPDTPKKSAFKAEWVTPGVRGVGVYNRASIAGKMLTQISPPEVYKIVDASTDGGEWYKILLADNSEGWVQSMDVSLTKKN